MRDRLALVLALGGCGPVVDTVADTGGGDTSGGAASTNTAGDPNADDDHGDDEDAVEPDDESSGAPGPTTDDIEGTSSSGDDPSEGCLFLCDPDGGPLSIECDIWAQDCPDGEKCMPWDNAGGSSWNATRCSPIDDSPAEVGDACTVEGSGVSGIDDCVISAMCWGVDTETNTGRCVGFCEGSEANPTCDAPGTSCAITNEGVLALCLPVCDPLLQDCEEGHGCYPIMDRFYCAPDAGEKQGAYGSPCEYLNVCDPGLFCAPPESVPNCASTGCCSSFCDFTELEASQMCPDFADGQECVAWYEMGEAPPGYEYVGACMVPS